MGKNVPGKKSFRSKIYSHIEKADSHIDNVKHSLERLVFPNARETERIILKKRLKVVSVLAFILMVVGSLISPKGKAEIATFYPTSCLGGWNNPSNAEGEPQVKSNDTESDFTIENSAVLPATTNADIYCGSFVGSVEQNTKPTKILVSLSWSKGENILLEQKIVSDSFASSSGEILDIASTTEVSFTLSSSTVATSTDSGSSTDSTAEENNSTTEASSTMSQVINAVTNVIDTFIHSEEETRTSSTTGSEVQETQEEINTSTETTTPQIEAPETSSTTSFYNSHFLKFSRYFITHVFAEETTSTETSPQQVEEPTPPIETVPANEEQVPPVETVPLHEEQTQSPETENTSTPEPETTNPETEILNTVEEATGTDEIITSENASTSSTTVLISDTASTTESTTTALSFFGTSRDVVTDMSADDESPNNFLEILYTFDGAHWNSLGKVNEVSMKFRTFEIPVTATTSWSDLNQLQIKIKPIQRIDATPAVYLDGIKIDVLYESPVLHDHPDFARDTILQDKSDSGVRVVNIINSDTNVNEIWYTTINDQGNYGVAPGTWVQAKLDQNLYSYKLVSVYGQNIFWVDDAQKMIWVVNLEEQTNDGIRISDTGTTTVQFSKNGEDWIFEYNGKTKEGLAHIDNSI